MITIKELAQQAVEETQMGDHIKAWTQAYTQRLFHIFTQTVKAHPDDWENHLNIWMHDQAPSGDSKNQA